MHFAILQRWEGDNSETVCLEYQHEMKEECVRMFEHLCMMSYKLKHHVTYRLIELDGEMQYPGKDMVDFRKKNDVHQIIVANGRVYDDIPVYVQRDLRKD